MAAAEQYDAVILGDGQAGGPLSTALVKAGRKTAVIERKHPGGTCVNEGCTPTKTMVASARVAYLTARSQDYGVETGPQHTDMTVVRRRKRAMVTAFRNSSRQAVESGGVDLIMGEGRFTGPNSIEVRLTDRSVRQLSADTIFINTGGRPSEPPIEGLKTVPYLDSTSIMELDEVPEHLLILGGGYIAMEFGQMFRRFGSRVTVVEQAAQILGREDEDIATAAQKILEDDGLKLHLRAEVTRAERDDAGAITLTFRTPDGTQTVAGSHLLVAVGRKPNTEALNLDAAGVEQNEHGYIKVNERLETNVSGIYALGDVAGSPPFTHIAYDDFRIVRANLLQRGHRTTTDRLIPYTVFIDPQLGRVGLAESEARSQGLTIKVATMPMNHVARALETDEPRGMVKAIVDAESKQILGAAVLGLEGGEIMAMIEIAMMGKLPYTALRDGIFAHPTLAELLGSLFGQIAD